jgi:hypothetical protein
LAFLDADLVAGSRTEGNSLMVPHASDPAASA